MTTLMITLPTKEVEDLKQAAKSFGWTVQTIGDYQQRHGSRQGYKERV